MPGFLLLLLGFLFVFPPCSALGETEDAESLYRKAEEGEWYGRADLNEIDALYARAAAAGSPYAFMADMRNRLAAADPEKQNRLAEQLCPKARSIMKKWEETAKPEPEALFYMARYYGEGICANRDVKKARAKLEAAAEAGNAKAQYYLARLLQKKDPNAAVRLFDKAAAAGFAQAVARLGSCYLLGEGVGKDEQKGHELIDKALATENSNAMYDVAIWYLDGSCGLAKDATKAGEILGKLAESGYEPAKAPLADLKAEKKKK